MDYTKVAKEILAAKDPGGELVKLLAALQTEADMAIPILIVQPVPDEGEGNPFVGITIITNTETDFPLDSDAAFLAWLEGYIDWYRKELANETGGL